MAASRLIAVHINKGKTVAQSLADRLEYSHNSIKTNDGEFVTGYGCDPRTAWEEFLLTKREYEQKTGRQQKGNVLAYQIRQSFKPGEITPEEANRLGYELAMRFTLLCRMSGNIRYPQEQESSSGYSDSLSNVMMPAFMNIYGMLNSVACTTRNRRI